MADRDAAQQPPADGGQNGLLQELNRLDSEVYEAVAATPTPSLDRAMRGLSQAANYSRLSIGSAALLALVGGPRGRQAAFAGLASVSATSAVVNLVVKPLGRRRRPDRTAGAVPEQRQVPMPTSRSFPSGHSAAAVAFASGAGRVLPAASVPLHMLAALVSYSRIHTGVHYPGDVVAGVLIGSAVADAVTAALTRAGRRSPSRAQGRPGAFRASRRAMATVISTAPRISR